MRVSLSFFVVFLFVFFGACYSVNVAAAPSNHEVTALLQGYEWELSRKDFEALPEDTYRTLIEIAGDVGALSFHRGRAVAALSLYQNEEVWLFFKQSIKNAYTGSESRRSLEAMCQTFSSSRGDELKKLLRPWLLREDSHFRVQTALCLQKLQLSQADDITKSALQDYEKAITLGWEYDKVFR